MDPLKIILEKNQKASSDQNKRTAMTKLHYVMLKPA